MPVRILTRIRRRQGVPVPAGGEPVTGQQIRASRMSLWRYERPAPGDLIHLDVK
ncbi:hypothetical protein [Actinomadura rugatobispora]|uniref:Uncharacterized protein n=1 Tax=Actinomadura rugatobispora TaxID=1994 RepID=A0ABW1A198_9ACTN